MSSFEAESDVTGTIARLFVYPVKSCAGIEVQEALLTETGLEFDRAWMLVWPAWPSFAFTSREAGASPTGGLLITGALPCRTVPDPALAGIWCEE